MPLVKTCTLVGLLLSLGSSTLQAQSATAFKTGENRTGSTKQCFYSFAGKQYTKTVEGYELCPLSIDVPMSPPTQPNAPTRPAAPSTATAFKTGENKTGSTKQCFYSFAGKAYTKTIESYELCPLSIEVPW